MSKYYYEFEGDSKYCYPNSDILRNKFDIKNPEILSNIEEDFTQLRITRAYKEPIIGDFSLKHLKEIHKFIFSDVYNWAGELRTVNIAKGVQFCPYNNIETEFASIYDSLKKDNFLLDLSDIDEAIEKYAYYLSEINVIHPFREGNGRTQRVYLNYLSRMSGYKLDFINTTKQEMIEACYDGFCCRYDKMEDLIRNSIVKISDRDAQYYRVLFGTYIEE